MKRLGTLRFAPQFLEGFNLTHLASQSGNTFFRVFKLPYLRFALPILHRDMTHVSLL
jgi:hypothetical protein